AWSSRERFSYRGEASSALAKASSAATFHNTSKAAIRDGVTVFLSTFKLRALSLAKLRAYLQFRPVQNIARRHRSFAFELDFRDSQTRFGSAGDVETVFRDIANHARLKFFHAIGVPGDPGFDDLQATAIEYCVAARKGRESAQTVEYFRGA